MKCSISKLEEKTSGPRKFTIDDVKDNAKSLHMYTGLQNYGVFQWLFKRLEIKAKKKVNVENVVERENFPWKMNFSLHYVEFVLG